MNKTRVLIIGGGPAGYTASIYAARAGLKPIQLLGMEPGGQLMTTTDVENYPGYKEIIQGPWLMEQMQGQATNMGVDIRYEMVTSVDFKSTPFKITTDDGNTYEAETVIIATGAKAKWLGIPSEEEFRGLGVSACATCDGFFFRNQRVVLVGGGNTAVEEALYMTNHASHVTLVHRRDTLRAEKILQDRLFAHPKITVIWDHVVDEILGGGTPKKVTAVSLKNVKTGDLKHLETDGVFVAIGHSPATEVFKTHLETDGEGYLLVKSGTTQTDIPGVFAAGDVQDKIYRQAVTAAGQGCMAALEAAHYLQRLGS